MDKGIIETIENGVIRVRITEADEGGCENCGVSGCSRAVSGDRYLEVSSPGGGFQPGQTVELTLGPGKRLLYYALLFLLPVVALFSVSAFVTGYYGQTAGAVAGAVSGIATFLVAALFLNRNASRIGIRKAD